MASEPKPEQFLPQVSFVKVFDVDAVFNMARPLIDAALDKGNGDLNYQYLLSECRADRARLWVSSNGDEITAAIIIRFENWSGKRICNILAMSAKPGLDLMPYFAALVKYAGQDADEIFIDGRPGWKRKLKEFGIEMVSAKYRIKL
jgi:hypothetical protein